MHRDVPFETFNTTQMYLWKIEYKLVRQAGDSGVKICGDKFAHVSQ